MKINIRRRGDKWMVDYTDEFGTRRRPSFPDEKSALECKVRLMSGEYPVDGSIKHDSLSLQQLESLYLQYLIDGYASAGTIRTVKSAFQSYRHVFGNQTKISKAQAEAWYDGSIGSKASKTAWSIMRAAWTVAIQKGRLSVSPFQRKKALKLEQKTSSAMSVKKFPFFTKQQVHDILMAAEDRPDVQRWVRIGVMLGLRFFEQAQLRIDDIFENYVLVRWGKGGTKLDSRPRKVPVAPELTPYLRDTTGLLVCLNHGKKWRNIYLSSALKRIYKKARIDPDVYQKRPIHILRHTYGTLMISEKKAQIIQVKQWMGHSNLQTTMRYVHDIPAPEMSQIFSANDLGLGTYRAGNSQEQAQSDSNKHLA